MAADKKKPIVPARLNIGDTVAIAAPAGHFKKNVFSTGVGILKKMGYRVWIPEGLFCKKNYLAGNDAHRAQLLNSLFNDPSVKAIACARGGFGSIKILSLLDFRAIRKHPKIFIGFSDITALLSTIYTRCGLVTFHGPLVTALEETTHKSRQAMFSALSSDVSIEISPQKKGVMIRSGSASGPVAGGNLTTLCHLVGTPFQPNFKNHILFLEDTGEAAYRIDRMLTQMKMAGCFNGIAGLALGSFEGCGKPDEIAGIVDALFRDFRIPILAGFEIGHGRNNMTIPVGLGATLDADRRILGYHMPATRK